MSIQVPWKRPTDAYSDDGPETEAIFKVGAATFVVTPTRHSGVNTGRTRYRVACATCGIVVHDATTGPAFYVESHVGNEHWSPP